MAGAALEFEMLREGLNSFLYPEPVFLSEQFPNLSRGRCGVHLSGSNDLCLRRQYWIIKIICAHTLSIEVQSKPQRLRQALLWVSMIGVMGLPPSAIGWPRKACP